MPASDEGSQAPTRLTPTGLDSRFRGTGGAPRGYIVLAARAAAGQCRPSAGDLVPTGRRFVGVRLARADSLRAQGGQGTLRVLT